MAFKPTFPEARLVAARLRPYFAAPLWRLIPVETVGLGTMGVDKHGRCYYDPVVFDSWTLNQCAVVILHELLHRLMRHDKRSTQLNVPPDKHGIWNVAADLEINQMLRDDGMTDFPLVPKPTGWDAAHPGEPWDGRCCLPEVHKAWQLESDNAGGFKLVLKPVPPKLTAEEYYQMLLVEPPPEQQKSSSKQGQGQPDPNEQQNPGQGKGQGNAPPSGTPGPGQLDNKPTPGKGNCGSAATGGKEHWEQGAPSDECPGQGDIESELASKEFAKAVQAAGNAPAGLKRWAGQVLEIPKVPWDVKLRAYLRDSLERRIGVDDSSFARPNRRQWGLWEMGIEACLPSGISPIPEVMVVIDTSGSMDDQTLKSILVEIKGVCRAINAPVKAVCVDHATYGIQVVNEDTIVRTKGGGGTDMRLGITLAAEQKPQPAVCIVLTDGYTPWPDQKPSRMGVIACLTEGGTDSGIPEWITTIKLEK